MNRFEFLIESAKFEVWAWEVHKIRLICFTFYRSPENQMVEFNAGRSSVKFGKHQQWKAKDYAIWDDEDEDMIIGTKELRWNDDPRYAILGEEWERREGIWGGRWRIPHDIYHFEG